jgi:hypothetical protein
MWTRHSVDVGYMVEVSEILPSQFLGHTSKSNIIVLSCYWNDIFVIHESVFDVW